MVVHGGRAASVAAFGGSRSFAAGTTAPALPNHTVVTPANGSARSAPWTSMCSHALPTLTVSSHFNKKVFHKKKTMFHEGKLLSVGTRLRRSGKEIKVSHMPTFGVRPLSSTCLSTAQPQKLPAPHADC